MYHSYKHKLDKKINLLVIKYNYVSLEIMKPYCTFYITLEYIQNIKVLIFAFRANIDLFMFYQ